MHSLIPTLTSFRSLITALAVAALAWPVSPEASAAAGAAAAAPRLVALPGHVHSLAQPRFDRGEAPASIEIGGLELVLARTPAQEQALGQLLAAQQDPKSAQYHLWLTPAEFGTRFGASAATVSALSHWLEAQGLKVDPLPAGRAWLHFHGTRAQLEAAFHTRIHLFEVDGVTHFANVTDPQVPAAIAPLITSIGGLNDFYPRSSARTRRAQAAPAGAQPQVTYDAGKESWVGPGDFAAMYNLQPLYQFGANGSGVTLAIVGASDIDPSVAAAFWTGFGLSSPQFSSIPVPGGQDPGQTSDNNEGEAYLDVEIAGGLAQGAKILLVRDKNVLLAAQYVISQNLAAILNISFGSCESSIGSQNTAISSLFQQAAAEGITVTVSAGDSGVAACAKDFTKGDLSTSGFAVNGIASTPYDLAVGGTEFDPTQSQAWAASNTPGTLVNAQGHIPEMVWNDSCANPLWAKALGFASTSVLCNTSTLNGQPNPSLEVAGGGGGLSSCITVSSGACSAGYTQPAWQAGVAGLQNFGARVIPDVSMIATNWVLCSYDVSPCDPAGGTVDIADGTSAAAPSVAAIIALLDQGMSTAASPDGRQGLINPQLYTLAAAEYGTSQSPNAGAAACSASLGTSIGTSCTFYNVTAGSNSMPCLVAGYAPAGTQPASTCTAPSGDANGIMEVNSSAQYAAAPGFNPAAGLGSINAANLLLAVYLPAPSGLAASSSAQSVALTWTAEPHASSFNIYQGTQSGQEGSAPVQTGATGASATVSGLQFGQTYFFTIAAESALGASPHSNEAKATVVPAAPGKLSASAGSGSVTLTWAAAMGASTYNVYQGTSSGAEAAQPVATGLSGTSTTISGLSNGTSYYFTVAGVDAGGASAMSPQAQATPAASGGGGELGLFDAALLALVFALRALRHPRCVQAAPRCRSPGRAG